MTRTLLASLVLFVTACSKQVEPLESYFTYMGFTLQETTLSKIQSQLGETTVEHHGDAGSSYTAICYQSISAGVTVYFETGEMGSSEILQAYRAIKTLKSDFPCLDLPKADSGSFQIGGLVLGSEIDRVIDALPPSRKSQNGMEIAYHKRVLLTSGGNETSDSADNLQEYFDESVWIELFPNDGRLQGFRVTKILSN